MIHMRKGLQVFDGHIVNCHRPIASSLFRFYNTLSCHAECTTLAFIDTTCHTLHTQKKSIICKHFPSIPAATWVNGHKGSQDLATHPCIYSPLMYAEGMVVGGLCPGFAVVLAVVFVVEPGGCPW